MAVDFGENATKVRAETERALKAQQVARRRCRSEIVQGTAPLHAHRYHVGLVPKHEERRAGCRNWLNNPEPAWKILGRSIRLFADLSSDSLPVVGASDLFVISRSLVRIRREAPNSSLNSATPDPVSGRLHGMFWRRHEHSNPRFDVLSCILALDQLVQK
jgi:hypothetical protein